MIQMVLQEVLGEFEFNLLYDSPHNLIWKNEINKDLYLHRKGSCSSKGMAQMMETNFAYYGEPVFIPGSMGTSSYILSGSGNKDYLYSASHGAGRALSRGKAIKISDKKIDEFLSQYVVITPVDTENVNVKNRPEL